MTFSFSLLLSLFLSAFSVSGLVTEDDSLYSLENQPSLLEVSAETNESAHTGSRLSRLVARTKKASAEKEGFSTGVTKVSSHSSAHVSTKTSSQSHAFAHSLGSAKFTPQCNCGCCSVQVCDGIATDLCLNGTLPICMLTMRKHVPQCDAWVDGNFIPFGCNPAVAWAYQSMEGKPPTSMNHNEFCGAFCRGSKNVTREEEGKTVNATVEIRDICIDNPLPEPPLPPCCACSKGEKPMDPPAFLQQNQQACSSKCCKN